MGQFVGIYKPVGPTSFEVVAKVRRVTGIKKVGHAGTLDPLASGVVVVGIGREATKEISTYVKHEKEYRADVHLGMTSTTGDMEGEKTVIEVSDLPTIEEVREALKRFVGEIDQVPPLYSAVKVKGRRAYALAREGKEVELEPRRVMVKTIGVSLFEWPLLKLMVTTGPGVYIRSLARDIGEALGTGGFLAGLERTRVGQFTKEVSVHLDEFEEWWEQNR
jgi:tRNA pseudouridine55 synthase